MDFFEDFPGSGSESAGDKGSKELYYWRSGQIQCCNLMQLGAWRELGAGSLNIENKAAKEYFSSYRNF